MPIFITAQLSKARLVFKTATHSLSRLESIKRREQTKETPSTKFDIVSTIPIIKTKPEF